MSSQDTVDQVAPPDAQSEPRTPHEDVQASLIVSYIPSKNFSPVRVKVALRDKTRFTGTIKKQHFTEIVCKQAVVVFDNKGAWKVDKDYAVFGVGLQIAPGKMFSSKTQMQGLDLKMEIKDPEPVAKPADAEAPNGEDPGAAPAVAPSIQLEVKLRHYPEVPAQKIAVISATEGDVGWQVLQTFKPPFVWSMSDKGISRQEAGDAEPKLEHRQAMTVGTFLQMIIAKISEAKQGNPDAMGSMMADLDPNAEAYGGVARTITMNLFTRQYQIRAALDALLADRQTPLAPEETKKILDNLPRVYYFMIRILRPLCTYVIGPAADPEMENPPAVVELAKRFGMHAQLIHVLANLEAAQIHTLKPILEQFKILDYSSGIFSILFGASDKFLAKLEAEVNSTTEDLKKKQLLWTQLVVEQDVDAQILAMMGAMIGDATNHYLQDKVQTEGGENYKKVQGKGVCNFSACDLPYSCRFGKDGESMAYSDWNGSTVQYGSSETTEAPPYYIRHFTSTDLGEDAMKMYVLSDSVPNWRYAVSDCTSLSRQMRTTSFLPRLCSTPISRLCTST